MNNYILKKSDNWNKKVAGRINEQLEYINVHERETHYIGVAISGFTYSQLYANEAGFMNAETMFNQVRDRDEVGSMYPRENKSFMPYSEDSNKIEKYIEDAFNLHEQYLRTSNIWLDLRSIKESIQEIYIDAFIKCFSNSQYVSCVFVACTIN